MAAPRYRQRKPAARYGSGMVLLSSAGGVRDRVGVVGDDGRPGIPAERLRPLGLTNGLQANHALDPGGERQGFPRAHAPRGGRLAGREALRIIVPLAGSATIGPWSWPRP